MESSDFREITWNEFNDKAKEIALGIRHYCDENSLTIDFICPILRGGGVLGMYLSHALNVIPILPVQYKYLHIGDAYEPTLLWETFSSLAEYQRRSRPFCVLLVEGNHYSGTTSQNVIELLKKYFDSPKIVYASLVRDYAYRNSVKDAIFNISGYISNESRSLDDESCEYEGIMKEASLFPWENVDEELMECNRTPLSFDVSLFCHSERLD